MFSYDDATVSDLYKDAYGFRPSRDWLRNWNAMTPDEKEATWDSLYAAFEFSMENKKRAEARAITAFESYIAKIREATNTDRKTAIRYFVESLDLTYTSRDRAGYICYTLGLPYSMENIFEEVLNSMRK